MGGVPPIIITPLVKNSGGRDGLGHGGYEEALALARDANEVYQRLGFAVGIEQTQELLERLEKRIAEGRR